MRLHRQLREAHNRVGDDLIDRLPVVDDAVDERGVGAVFEQAPHQIGEQVLVAADRRVNPAGVVEMLGSDDLLVERFPHAVQALEFPVPAIAGHFENRGNGMRVVRCELRIEGGAMGEQPARAGEIGDIGRDFARVHRIAVEPALLRALDLAVPIGAFDQADHQAPPAAPGKIGEPVDDRQGSLLIGLNGEAEPIPAGEARRERQPLDEVEREFEAIGFFGIDREADAGSPGMTSELEQAREQFPQHPIALRHFVARVQRRQLYRDARRLGDVPVSGRPADRRDRMIIGGRSSARRRPRCAPPRRACRRNAGSRGARPRGRARSPPRSCAR